MYGTVAFKQARIQDFFNGGALQKFKNTKWDFRYRMIICLKNSSSTLQRNVLSGGEGEEERGVSVDYTIIEIQILFILDFGGNLLLFSVLTSIHNSENTV